MRYINLTQAAAETRQWQQRRTDQGKVATSDDVWAYIRRRWGDQTECLLETVFQNSHPK